MTVFRSRASGRAQVYNAGGDMSVDQSSHHYGDNHVEIDLDPVSAFFTGRGPGRILMVLGLCVAAFGLTGWMSLVTSGFGDISGPSEMLGRRLGSGIPVGVVYFLGFPFGGVLFLIGRSMAKAAAKQAGPLLGHLATTLVVLGAAVGALAYSLGGSSPAALAPSFGAGASVATGPPVLVSDTDRTRKRGGLTLTVTKVENVGGHGVVHLTARNNTSSSIVMDSGALVLTDGAGKAYRGAPFSGGWNRDLGSGGRQAGSVTLGEEVALGTGELRVEFTSLFGFDAPDSIAVDGIAVDGIAVDGIASR